MSNANGHTGSKRAVLYARVSSDDRGKDGRNLAGQLEMCREYAQGHDWRIVAELAEDDRGASGAAFDLPKLTEALEMASRGEYDVLVTREIDRFARRLAKQLIVEEELKRSGVQIEYVLGDYDDTPEGALMKNVRAVIAEYERLKINERMMRGRRQKVKAGNVMTRGLPPYGYCEAEHDGKATLELEEQTARIVRMIYDWYTGEDKLSIRAIRDRLEEMSVPTAADLRDRYPSNKQHDRGVWSTTSIHNILKNETYAGTWHYGKRDYSNGEQTLRPKEEWIAVDVPAIVDRDTWQAAQARRRKNKRKGGTAIKYDYLLRRRAKCGHCGAAMIGVSRKVRGKRYHYYKCAALNYPKKYRRDCDLPHFRVCDIDRVVWQWVKGFITNPEKFIKGRQAIAAEQQEATAPTRNRIAVIDGLLQENHEALERTIDLYISGDVPREMLVERKQRIEEAIQSLEEERAEQAAELDAATLERQHYEDAIAFAERLQMGLEETEAYDFDTRLFFLEKLDVSTKMLVVDGRRKVKVRFAFGPEVLLDVSNGSG